MAKGGVDGFETAAPLVPQWFTGYRSWGVTITEQGAAVLRSVTYDYTWTAGINTATCMSKPAVKPNCKEQFHPDAYVHVNDCYTPTTCAGVTLNCGCGYWCYDTPTNWFTNNGSYHPTGVPYTPGRPWVTGIVHGFGRMVVGEKGFRAGKALIAALIMPPHISPLSIPNPFGADIDRDELAQYRAEEAAYLQERLEDGLRSTFPTVPFYRTREAALKAVPLTPLREFIDNLKDDEEAA